MKNIFVKINKKIKKIRANRKNALAACPQKKGMCVKIYLATPKKPNSALRKIARIQLTNKKLITGYIPGKGHTLQKFSTVLVRAGRVRDLPGVRYKLIRNKYDLLPVTRRASSRSKYGIKSFKRNKYFLEPTNK
jgi:small subunit ribosomal protein S12